MGCDIHAHIEVRKDYKWYHFAAPRIDRNYGLFTIIAGQRLGRAPFDMACEPGVASMRVLPDNMSEVTKVCYEQDKSLGPHDVCVLDADGIRQLQLKLNRHYNDDDHNSKGCDLEWDVFHTYINGSSIAAHSGWDDVRIVCWFDN